MKTHERYIDSSSEYYVYTPSVTAKKLLLYPTHIGFFQYKPNYSLRRSNFHNFLIMLILDGECDLKLNEQTFHAEKGSLIFIDCYSPHEYKSSYGWKALWLHFDGSIARNYYDYLFQKYGNIIMPTEFHTIYSEMNEILNIFKSGDAINEIEISQKITCILNRLLDISPNNTLISHSPIKDAVSYINEHFAEPLSLKDLSEKACLSPFYFTRVFTKETGMTPYQYLIFTRISAAKFLLKSTAFSIKEIGFQCGFTNVSSFCSAFKKWEGQTPGDYRSSI